MSTGFEWVINSTPLSAARAFLAHAERKGLSTVEEWRKTVAECEADPECHVNALDRLRFGVDRGVGGTGL